MTDSHGKLVIVKPPLYAITCGGKLWTRPCGMGPKLKSGSYNPDFGFVKF